LARTASVLPALVSMVVLPTTRNESPGLAVRVLVCEPGPTCVCASAVTGARSVAAPPCARASEMLAQRAFLDMRMATLLP